jgi:hypothetical protein
MQDHRQEYSFRGSNQDGHQADSNRRTCATLSDFFLDTMLTSSELEYIARDLDELPILISEIEKFLWDEVLPA